VRLYLPNKMTCLVDLCSNLICSKEFPQGRGHLKICLLIYFEVGGSVVVKALCFKPEGIRFETRLRECIFLMYLIFPAALGLGVYSASNINQYQKQQIMFLGSKARLVRRTDKVTAICEPIV
jgi:hypothetical protein